MVTALSPHRASGEMVLSYYIVLKDIRTIFLPHSRSGSVIPLLWDLCYSSFCSLLLVRICLLIIVYCELYV